MKKPCPFCGEKVSLIPKVTKKSKTEYYQVICPENSICQGSGIFTVFRTPDIKTAIEVWNNRR